MTDGARWGRRAGITLVELLVVIAITAVLLTLLFGPLLTGFQLTARAQATTQAQDSARVAMEQISRELGSAAGVRDTTGQYLNLQMHTQPNPANPAVSLDVTARAHNAYIDIVPPREAPIGSALYITDPTVDPTRPTQTLTQDTHGDYILTTPAVGVPLAPGTSIIRYFIGLRRPINLDYVPGGATTAQKQPYQNVDEGQTVTRTDPTYGTSQVVTSNLNNTYILYRAEVNPFVKSVGPPVQYIPNAQFFAADPSDSTKPVLDDPNFFNVVEAGDTNPADPTGTPYTAAQAQAHNDRVYYWFRASKPVIDLRDINLIFQPHDGQGKVVYNSDAQGYISNTQTEADITGTQTPILRTSVSFGPGTVSNDPLSATATSDISQGYGASPGDATSSYLPSLYKGHFGQWQGAPNITVNTPDSTHDYQTYVASGTPTAPVKAGDLVERDQVTATDVYDVSLGTVLNNSANYVAMSVDGDPGNVNFAIPDIPYDTATSTQATVDAPDPTGAVNTVGSADATNHANSYWAITYGSSATDLQIHLMDNGSVGDVDLLPEVAYGKLSTTANAAGFVPNGHVVVNSERVYGPEQQAGPGSGDPAQPPGAGIYPAAYPLVAYRRVPYDESAVSSSASLAADTYMIDYNTGVVYLGAVGTNINTLDTFPQRRTVLIEFSFQNNSVLPVGGAATVQPDTVFATYQTGSAAQVSVGVRVYDPASALPTYFSLTNNVAVGNASR